MSPIPPKGSIPGRKPRGRAGSDMNLGNLLGGFGGLLGGTLKGLGKTVEGIQNLNLEDLEKLAEAQGNEEAKERIRELKEKAGEGSFDLNKLIDLAKKQGVVRTGVRGHILGKRFGGDLPIDRRGPQETKFEVKGTRKSAPEKLEVQELEMEVYPEEKQIKVIGEIPGVEEKNITCEVKEKGRVLSISTEGRKRYAKEVELPSPVTKTVSWSYRNGVLEVILTKKQG